MKNIFFTDESVKRQITDSISKNLTDSDSESMRSPNSKSVPVKLIAKDSQVKQIEFGSNKCN